MAVLFHCQGGRDRAGLIAMLVLRWLVWSRRRSRTTTSSVTIGCAWPTPRGASPTKAPSSSYLSEIGTTARYVIVETLRSLDVEARLRASGFSETDVASVRRRLLGPG